MGYPTYRRTIREQLAEEAVDLDHVQRELVREKTIRTMMAKTGESREIVVEAVDSMAAMDEEAVFDLTDGNPTTLRDALERYVDQMTTWDNQTLIDVQSELATILAYPYPGEGNGA